MLGSRYSEFLQKDVSEYIQLMETLRREAFHVSQALDSLGEAVPLSTNHTDHQTALAHSVFESNNARLERILKTEEEAEAVLERIGNRVVWGPKEEMLELLQNLRDELSSLGTSLEGIRRSADALRSTVSVETNVSIKGEEKS